MKKKNLVIQAAICAMVLCACKNGGEQTPPMTVSQEIAVGISENIVPIEATEYSFLTYQVPAGFAAANDNTDMQSIFVSETQDDYSYIAYVRQANDQSINYMALTAEDYANMFSLSLESAVTVSECRQEEKEGWQQIELELSYSMNGVPCSAWQYYYVTDKYVFSMIYVQAGTASWKNAFMECASQTRPQSLVEAAENGQ